MPRAASDQELVEQTLAGSEEAAAELFRRYWRQAWQGAYVIVGRRFAADDIAQAAFERAFGALAGFDQRRPFGPWFHRIVVNLALDFVRRERAVAPLAEMPEATDWLGERLPDVELAQALAGLSAERRAIVVLRYWLDYAPTEIAQVLDIPVGTVQSRLSRALSELKSQLEVSHVGKA